MRRLTCTRCRETVRVHEEPCEFIDPARYVCKLHLQPVKQLSVFDVRELGEREETWEYDPALAAVPF